MFTNFWQLHPIKRGDKKKIAAKFNKLSKADQQSAIDGVKRELAYRAKMAQANEWVAGWCHPQTYINGRRWEDELIMPEAAPIKTNDIWEQLCSKVGEVSRTEYPEWDDPKIAKALFAAGSWMQFLAMPEKKQLFEFKPKFLECYKSIDTGG